MSESKGESTGLPGKAHKRYHVRDYVRWSDVDPAGIAYYPRFFPPSRGLRLAGPPLRSWSCPDAGLCVPPFPQPVARQSRLHRLDREKAAR